MVKKGGGRFGLKGARVAVLQGFSAALPLFKRVGGGRGELSNPQKITCIIFENLFVPYFLPHQSHNYGYAPSSGENLTSKMSFKSDATYYFHIT